MSSGNNPSRKVPDLDFLKTIVGDERSNISKIDEEDEGSSTPRLSLPSAKPSSPKAPLKVRVQIQDQRTEYEDEYDRPSRTEMWARGELDDSELDRYEFNRVQRKPPRPKSGRPVSGRPVSGRPISGRPKSGRPQSGKATNNAMTYEPLVDPAAHRLERKYLELKELLMGTRPSDGPTANKDLVKLATRMARKYHLEAQGLVPGAHPSHTPQHAVHRFSPRSRDLLNGTADGRQRHHILYSPRSDQGTDSYILIDGTGAVIQTKQVWAPEAGKSYSNPDSDIWGMEPDVKRRPRNRGRAQIRRPPSGKKPATKSNAWGSKSTSQATSAKSSPSKRSPKSSRSRSGSSSRSRSSSREKSKKKANDYYSDSFTSDSSRSRSRSRSSSRTRSKKKTCDLHLKYTKNEKLLEWLKEKDQLHKEGRKQKRKERREKRKAQQAKIEEKEKLKEKSEKAVKEWMKRKRVGGLLPRRRQNSGSIGQQEGEELVVLDEMLDLREHGARIDPSEIPAEVLQKSEGNTDRKEEGEEKEEAEKSESTESQNEEKSESKENKRPLTAHPPPHKPEGHQSRFRRSGRGQSASTVPYSRPVSAKKGRFSEGAKEKVRLHKEKVLAEQEKEQKKRISYDEWLKSKRNEPQNKEGDTNNREEKTELKKKISYDEWCKRKEEGRDKSPAKDPSNKEQPKAEVKFEEKAEQKGVHVIRGADSKVRPKSSKKPAVKKEPPSDKQPVTPIPEESPQPQQSTTTPRPPVKKTEAYKAVKHEQKSWDNFSDHVWKEVNANEEDNVDVKQSADRPEPQGSDAPDDVSKKATKSDGIAEQSDDAKANPAEETGETNSQKDNDSEKDNIGDKVTDNVTETSDKAEEQDKEEATEETAAENSTPAPEEPSSTTVDEPESTKVEESAVIKEEATSASAEETEAKEATEPESTTESQTEKADDGNNEEKLESSDREFDRPEPVSDKDSTHGVVEVPGDLTALG